MKNWFYRRRQYGQCIGTCCLQKIDPQQVYLANPHRGKGGNSCDVSACTNNLYYKLFVQAAVLYQNHLST